MYIVKEYLYAPECPPILRARYRLHAVNSLLPGLVLLRPLALGIVVLQGFEDPLRERFGGVRAAGTALNAHGFSEDVGITRIVGMAVHPGKRLGFEVF